MAFTMCHSQQVPKSLLQEKKTLGGSEINEFITAKVTLYKETQKRRNMKRHPHLEMSLQKRANLFKIHFFTLASRLKKHNC